VSASGATGLATATAPSLRVAEFTGAPTEWDGFVRAQPHWTHFHLHGWRTVMERALRHETIYLCARDGGGALAGVLPLVRVKSRLFGHYLVSMPFVNYGGPLGSDNAIRALGAHAAGLVVRDGVRLLEMRSRRELPLDIPVSHRKLTSVIDLTAGTPDSLIRSLPPSVRTKIRKSQKAGVTVRFGADQIAPFHQVFSEHMRFLGTPTHGRALFETIAAEFPDSALFACAYLKGKPVACGAGFTWNEEFEMTWASALRAHDEAKPNMGLYGATMEHVMAAGCRVFNFGRSTPGSGTHKFKSTWGARDEQLWWYGVARAGQPAATPSPNEGAFSWGPRIWSELPLGLTRWLGPRVVRFIP